MKTQKIVLLIIALIFSSAISYAQPGFANGSTKLMSGSVKALKGQTALSVIFSYDDMLVGGMTEENYIIKKTQEQNKMKSGSGDEWAVKWKEDKAARFEPEFMKWLNSSIKKLGIVATSVTGDASTTYTLKIQTLKIEPGVYTGVSVMGKSVGEDTYIDIQATLVETANPSEELAVIMVSKVIGQSVSFANYDVGLRIMSSYQSAGKNLGSCIVKNCK
ncbi:MAG TPA: hypothetical protein PKN48_11530 [Bacteroidales bacterium]|nr:hypothetical protein [Bacteroidales bacterium]